jgi:hypothetical protein
MSGTAEGKKGENQKNCFRRGKGADCPHFWSVTINIVMGQGEEENFVEDNSPQRHGGESISFNSTMESVALLYP